MFAGTGHCLDALFHHAALIVLTMVSTITVTAASFPFFCVCHLAHFFPVNYNYLERPLISGHLAAPHVKHKRVWQGHYPDSLNRLHTFITACRLTLAAGSFWEKLGSFGRKIVFLCLSVVPHPLNICCLFCSRWGKELPNKRFLCLIGYRFVGRN